MKAVGPANGRYLQLVPSFHSNPLLASDGLGSFI